MTRMHDTRAVRVALNVTPSPSVIGKYDAAFAELNVILVQQPPVPGHFACLVADQAQGPGREDEGHLLLVVFEDHED